MAEINPVSRDGGALYELITLWQDQECLFLVGTLLLESNSCGIVLERRSDELAANTNLVLKMLQDREMSLDKWQNALERTSSSFTTMAWDGRTDLFWAETNADQALLCITQSQIACLNGEWHQASLLILNACYLIETYRAKFGLHRSAGRTVTSWLGDEPTVQEGSMSAVSPSIEEIEQIRLTVYSEQKSAITALKRKWLYGDKPRRK
jgi:hypothetical protein